ncbi:class I SAM-dependent methyltransferase [Mycobacterium asiaticum]|uniref:class I SAM-dependent methyltransferase n=1 Tax=Mycobacterium asiaticum TaxID=1790 RepID=UPI001F300337|nr:class I SAM-dependent methyltransferase [Mycobacterium asiaticum]
MTRRYGFRNRRRMLKALGNDLGTTVTWNESDEQTPVGPMADIFATTANIHKWLHYLPVYESVVSPFRARPVRMLEIGVARGGSLQMWRRYLDPSSIIVGVDIDPSTRQFDDPAREVHVRVGSQDDTTFLKDIITEFGPFDIILDDGSHMTSHVVNTFRFLFPHGLASGGVYIVEDISAHYWKEYRDTRMSFVDFTKWLIDAMHAHYQKVNKEIDYRLDHPYRKKKIRVPLATTLVEKVEFYDSIAAIHRAQDYRKLPRSVFR